MTNANTLYNQAELAFASYATLDSGLVSDQIKALEAADFSTKQAEEFATRYTEVVTQFNDTETSFSATIFKDVTGNLTLAIKGTLELGDFAPTDFNIGLHGAGYDQILAMKNWWLRASTQSGQSVQQLGIQHYLQGIDQIPEGAVFLYSEAGNGPVPIARDYYMVPIASVAATGELTQTLAADSDGRLDVTGHSLGGHLAMTFGTLFSGYTSEITTFNTPGFIDSARNQNFFAALGGSVPTGQSTTNVIANEASGSDVQWNAIAGAHSRPGTPVDIAIEDQAGLDSNEPNPAGARNHSQMVLTDSLAVYNMLNELAPTLTTDMYKTILDTAANRTSASYEGIVDVLEALLGINDTLLPTGNNERNALYEAIYRVRDTAEGYRGQLTISSVESLVNAATLDNSDGLAYRYALTQLNTFAISGIDYSTHADALTLYDPATGQGVLTEEWLVDRAQMLEQVIRRNTADSIAVVDGTAHNETYVDLVDDGLAFSTADVT